MYFSGHIPLSWVMSTATQTQYTAFWSTKPPPNKELWSQSESDSVLVARSLSKGPFSAWQRFQTHSTDIWLLVWFHRDVVWSPLMCPTFNPHSGSSSWEEINATRQVGSESELQSFVFKRKLFRGCSLD